jgi:DNA-binding NarL/FixJ family response regulator
MSKDKAKDEVKEFIDEKAEGADSKKASLRELIDGSIITRKSLTEQLPFLLFLTLIASVYIGNRYHAEKVYRDMMHLQSDVQDLRAQSITTASELMFISKQSEVARMVREQGLELEEAVRPPIKIKKW